MMSGTKYDVPKGDAQYWSGLPVVTQDDFFCHLVGQSAPTRLAIVHWVGCIKAIKWAILWIEHKIYITYHF